VNGKRDPILLFDGVCNLCNGTVNFVIDHDPEGRFRFATLQSDAAMKLARDAGVDPRVGEGLESVVLIEGGRGYTRSTAILRVARLLELPWSLLYGFIILPPFIRDAAYNIVAASRYRMFGRKDVCRVPTPELRARFLDTSPQQ
jgi:predicted DCC family thiol-disulfide oxidoreductase YuxK